MLKYPEKDVQILRDLAKRVADAAADPIQEERRNLWKKHNSLQDARPLIFISPEGSWGELITEKDYQCEDKDARAEEGLFLNRLYYINHLKDDTVIEPNFDVKKVIWNSGLGLQPKQESTGQAKGAYAIDQVLKGPEDLKKFKMPEVFYDEEATKEKYEHARELYGDILEVRLRGIDHISFHLPAIYVKLRGMGETMMDMVTEPQMLHDALTFLRDAQQSLIDQYDEMNLFTLNNDGTYHNSGGVGYTDELPPDDFDPDHVHPKDMWASAESQEYAQVGPDMHWEFALQYEKPLMEQFALSGYGCCEDLTGKLDYVFQVENMRRISISPWANVDKCAEKLGDKYIFSWKPHPSHLVGKFNEEAIRKYIDHTIEACQANNCRLEMILKDTHTCENHPERFDRWSATARSAVEDAMQ